MTKKTLLIVTTVPITLQAILRHQPRFLATYYNIAVATSPGGACKNIELDEGVAVHPVRMYRGISPLRDLIAICSMIQIIRKVRPDAIHSYTPKAGLVSMVAGWLCRVPLRIHTFTGLIFPTQKGLKQKILLLVDFLICCLATRIGPEGEGVKRDIISYLGIAHDTQALIKGSIKALELSPSERNAISEKAKCRVEEHFPLDVTVDKWLSIYRRQDA